jgi:hypothetical protein
MLAIYHRGREVARIPRPLRPPGGGGLNLAQGLTTPQLGNLGLFEEAERLANIVKWTGIGILTLAGAVLIFKVTDLVLGD